MEWVAEVVDQGQRSQLSEDRHAAIGPSHFMRSDLDDNDVSLIWEHSVLPYIEERLFGYDGARSWTNLPSTGSVQKNRR